MLKINVSLEEYMTTSMMRIQCSNQLDIGQRDEPYTGTSTPTVEVFFRSSVLGLDSIGCQLLR